MPKVKEKQSLVKKAWYRAERVLHALRDPQVPRIEPSISESPIDESSERLCTEAGNLVSHTSLQPDDWDCDHSDDFAGPSRNIQTRVASSTGETEVKNSVIRSLQSWAVSQRITQTAVTSLLKILKDHHCFSELPSDARTLFKTPRLPSAAVVDMGLGRYCHFGLFQG